MDFLSFLYALSPFAHECGGTQAKICRKLSSNVVFQNIEATL